MHVRTRLAVAGGACVALLLAGGLAAAQPAGPGKGTPSAPPPAATGTEQGCTLRPAAHRSPRHEWASCLAVSATMDRAPAAGETATLRFEVTAGRALTGVRVEADLPGNLRWASAPAGMQRALHATAAPEAGGRVDRASAVRALAAGETARFEGTVTATAAGPAHVRVRAAVPVPGGTDAAEDSVFLTVGAKAGASTFGFQDAGGAGAVAPIAKDAVPERATPHLAPGSVGTEGLPKPFSDDPEREGASAQATACVTGGWFYVDNAGVTRPSINFQVQAWDDDTTSGDDLLAVGVTDFSGGYTLCFDNDDGFLAGTQDVYVLFVSENSLWRVRRTGTNDNFSYVTGTVNDVPDGSTTSFGNLQPADGTHMRGLHAFDSANDAWLWVPGSGCWDPLDGTCRQVVINWAPDSADGTYYSLGGNDVHLAAADPDAPITVVHEIGHAVMDDAYEDDYPPAPSCSPHSIQGASSAGCAWTEGWAEWFPSRVYNDPFFRWPNGASLNLETPTWGTAGWGNGDTVEGRVAGALIDVSDTANEQFWDRYGEGAPGNVWATFTTHVSDTMAQFWSHRTADGFNVAASGALASLYQNTIDYAFRDPLGNYAQLTRPTPTPHNYSYNTTTIYWSVVAVRPPAGADYDLTLYDDAGQATALASSAFGSNAVDFVAVDSNRRPLGDYYPRAYAFSGSGSYQVELAQGSDAIGAGASQAIAMASTDVVAVRDAFLSAGVPVTFTVTAGNATQDAELFLMESTATASTWVRSRAQAVRSSTAAGPGGTEQVTFTPTQSAWYGVVLVNKAGSGTYTLQRS